MHFKKPQYRIDSIKIVKLKKNLHLGLCLFIFTIGTVTAQTTPQPPETPKTNVSKSYSVCVEDDKDDKHNSSISVSVSDHSYKFRANFHSSKNDGIKTIIMKKMGDTNLSNYGNTYIWTNAKSDTDIYEFKLSKGYLRMYVDTDSSSKAFVEKVNDLGNELKIFVSGKDHSRSAAYHEAKAKQNLNRAKRDLERAKRDLERAQRELKRAQEQAKGAGGS